jgi:hypothetical protein
MLPLELRANILKYLVSTKSKSRIKNESNEITDQLDSIYSNNTLKNESFDKLEVALGGKDIDQDTHIT